jgi:Trypsin-like peptidase domain
MADLRELIDLVRPSVVQITYSVDGLTAEQLAQPATAAAVRESPGINTVSGVLGTGFIVNEDAHVVTAKHVLDAARAVAAQFANAQVGAGLGLGWPSTENMRSNFYVVGFEVVEEDARNDLALVRATPNPLHTRTGLTIAVAGSEPMVPLFGVANLRSSRPRDGDGIGISGYPLNESALVTNVGIVASAWPFLMAEMPHPTIAGQTMRCTRDIYLGDVQSNPVTAAGRSTRWKMVLSSACWWQGSSAR